MSNSFRDEYNNDRERSFSGHESSTRSQLQSLRDKYRLSNSTTTAPLTRESLATFSHTRHERGANPSHTTSTTTNPPSSTYSKPATTDRLNVNNYRDSRLNDSFSSAGSAGRLRDIYQDTYLSTDARSYGSAPDHTSAYTPTYDRDYDTSRYSASLKRRESLSPSRGNTYSTKLPSRHEGSPHYGVSSSINNNSSANSNMGPFSTDDGQKYFPNGYVCLRLYVFEGVLYFPPYLLFLSEFILFFKNKNLMYEICFCSFQLIKHLFFPSNYDMIV